MILLVYLTIGAFAGFVAGLFGVGGGLIIVPILYAVFVAQGYDPSYIMHMALGTSLATIIVTSISSISAHHKKGAVIWQVVKNLTPGLAIGSFLGAAVADILPSHILQLIIACFAFWVAMRMFKGSQRVVDTTQQLPSKPKQLLAGGGIGIASAIFGIGGGSITVPYLTRYGVVMQKAVGTSAACGLPIAIAGALGFMIFGMQTEINVPNTLGFIHVYAFIGISVMSFFTAKLGAKTAHALSPAMLKKCFAVLLVIVGTFFLLKGLIG